MKRRPPHDRAARSRPGRGPPAAAAPRVPAGEPRQRGEQRALAVGQALLRRPAHAATGPTAPSWPAPPSAGAAATARAPASRRTRAAIHSARSTSSAGNSASRTRRGATGSCSEPSASPVTTPTTSR